MSHRIFLTSLDSHRSIGTITDQSEPKQEEPPKLDLFTLKKMGEN